ncbi:MAG: PD40 domain-containing protein [Flavobacteriaceae bacterium]|nr:PD40 domain-containing protein [Flavobacteriaceae bacterium]
MMILQLKKYSTLIVLILTVSCTSIKKDKLLYIDSEKPSLTPKIFSLNFISKENESEFGSTFSKDGTEFFFAVNVNGKSEIRYSKLEKGSWIEPITILSHKEYKYADPILSPDEKELYYISDMPLNKKDTIKDHDIWYSRKIKNKWSMPINAGKNINSLKNEYYISFSSDGTMYFASNKNAGVNREHDFDIYYSKKIDGKYRSSIRLSDSINTKRYEADVFISPDESYMIFCSARKEGLGKGDLYISFKNHKGEWGKSKNMGEIINSKNHELCPFVTSDGKYLFYTSNENIYWVRSELIEKYR